MNANKLLLSVAIFLASCGSDPAAMPVEQPDLGGMTQVDASGAGGATQPAGTGGTAGAPDAGAGDLGSSAGGAGGRTDGGSAGAGGTGGSAAVDAGRGGAGGGVDAGTGGAAGVGDAGGGTDTAVAGFCPQYPGLTSSSCAVLGANSIPIYRWRGDIVCGTCSTGTKPTDQKSGCKVVKPTPDLPSDTMLCVLSCLECCYKQPNMPCSTNSDCCSPLSCQDNGPSMNKTCK